MDRNRDYWKKFYKDDISQSLVESSDFSKFVLNFINKETPLLENISEKTFLDIGCGNGKDTFYMRNNGINASGIDLSCDINSPYFRKMDALDICHSYDFYYMRFFLHTIEEHQMDILMKNILKYMKENSYIFIETRSSRGITKEEKKETNFKSSIGDAHFRMLYSLKYLVKKFDAFNIIYSRESSGLAPFRGDDPYIIRMILGKND